MNLSTKGKSQMKHRCILIIILYIAIVSFTGCVFSGTYTHDGTNAIMMYEGDIAGTARVSGNTLTGVLFEETFNAMRKNNESNPFIGRWTGSHNSLGSIEITISNTVWVASIPTNLSLGTFGDNYIRHGNNARLEGDMYGFIGTASISNNRLTGTIEGESFNAIRSNTTQNPFVGGWQGQTSDGTRVEIVVSETAWAFRLFE